MEKWFDPTVYMQNKLAQMQATDPAYTMSDLVAAFAKAGFVGPEGYFQHFQQFGAAEEVAPNAYFNANEYYAAKAAQFYDDKFDGSELQIAQVKALINKEGMNAWTHYQQFGSAEGVNPSNAFDASDYCAAKAAAMNKAGQKAPDGTDWTAEKIAKAIDDAGMSVLEHYLTYAGTDKGEVAAGSTYPVADDDQVVVPNPGETFVLKEGIEQLQGTSGDDVFKAEGKAMDAGDVTDGGAGNDTLEVYGDAELKGTFTNIENLVIANATKANNDKAIDLSAFSGSFTLKGGSDAAVEVGNVTGQKLVLDGTTKAIKLTATMADTQTSANLVSQNAGNAVEFSLTGKALTDVNLVTDGANKDTISGTDTIKNVNVTATGDADVTLKSMDKLENVTVAGAGGVTVDLSSATKAVFTGGAGNDTITLKGSTKAHTLGAGDDTVVVNDAVFADLVKGFSVDGGKGTDTLSMVPAVATDVKMTADFFNKTFTNFEELALSDDLGASINMANFAGIDHLTLAGTSGAVTVSHMQSGSTLELGNGSYIGGITVDVDGTAAGQDDVLNIVLSEDPDLTANTVSVTDVETINIVADDSNDDANATHSMILTADKATTVKVSGDAKLDLTLTGSSAVNKIDASESTGGLEVHLDTNNLSGITVTGSSAADKITLGFNNTVNGMGGDDTFTVTKSTDGKVNTSYSTIQGFAAGDKLNITGVTAVVNAETIQGDTLDAAVTSAMTKTDSATTAVSFTWGNDTYVVMDTTIPANNTFETGDFLVKLAGVTGVEFEVNSGNLVIA